MIRFILIILIIFSLFIESCTGRKNKPDHSELIPDKDLISIISEVYLADGLLTIPKIHHWFSPGDSILPYYQVIEKYGYSKETMDKTMKYYMINKPEKLTKIYDMALGVLSEMGSYFEIEIQEEAKRNRNLWRGRRFYSFPVPASTDSACFLIKLPIRAIYTLDFSATRYPDDQSVNPRITVFLCNADSLETGKKQYIKTLGYIKDGHPHTYSLTVEVPDKTSAYFSGCFLDMDNHPDQAYKHARFDNISITYTTSLR